MSSITQSFGERAPLRQGAEGEGRLPLILMYHRVHDGAFDPWYLAVSPERFDGQLSEIGSERHLVPLSWLAGRLRGGELPRDVVALTFDDGYADALTEARPILVKHGAPATFFLPSKAIREGGGFWWDTLARLLLRPEPLPERIELTLGGRVLAWSTAAAERPEQANGALWPRELLQAIRNVFKGLAEEDRSRGLDDLAAQLDREAKTHPEDRTLTMEEAAALIAPGFLDVGGHTMTHPSLTSLGFDQCRGEIEGCMSICRDLAGAAPVGFAYPYGDHDDVSAELVAAAGFGFACTTIAEPVSPPFDLWRLPRLYVGNWPAAEFRGEVERAERS